MSNQATTYILSVCADLSEASLEAAWEQAHRPEYFSLYVAPDLVDVARTITAGLGGKPKIVLVRPDWSGEKWMLSSRYTNIFCEGI